MVGVIHTLGAKMGKEECQVVAIYFCIRKVQKRSSRHQPKGHQPWGQGLDSRVGAGLFIHHPFISTI